MGAALLKKVQQANLLQITLAFGVQVGEASARFWLWPLIPLLLPGPGAGGFTALGLGPQELKPRASHQIRWESSSCVTLDLSAKGR